LYSAGENNLDKSRLRSQSSNTGQNSTSFPFPASTSIVDLAVQHLSDLGFKNMIQDIVEGKIGCLIVKDYCAIIGLNQKDLENQGILA